MIVFYQKSTGKIVGTMNGFEKGNFMIKPEKVDEKDMDRMVLDVKFEAENPNIIRDLLSYRVVDGKVIK